MDATWISERSAATEALGAALGRAAQPNAVIALAWS